MAIKRYKATKDNTITNAFKSSLLETQRGTGSNMGMADVVEVFSIYGEASGSDGLSQELTRVLIEFPISTISTDRTAGTIPASGSVSFYLKMYNARHAFTLPRQFNLVVQPISASWEEGVGLDMEEYTDRTYDNSGSNWMRRGKVGAWDTVGGDYHTGSGTPTYNVSFPNGYEDLELDISEIVENWILGSSGGKYDNYGLSVRLTASQEAYFSSSAGTNTAGGIIQNTVGATESYYTKKFFARSSEFFFKRPVIEARWDSRLKDDRGSFYLSSSLAPGPDNLNTIYLYNYVRGRLVDIPACGTGTILLSLYSGSSSPTGSKLSLPVGGGVVANLDTNVTGGWYKTGIYSASFAATGSLTQFYDVWHTGSTQFFTGSIAPKTLLAYNNAPSTQYVTAISNLKDGYIRSETARFRLYVRPKQISDSIYSVATANIPNETIVSASYRIFRRTDNLNVIPYGTGSDKSTYLSYDVSGNYFDFDMSMLEAGYAYGLKFVYYNDSIKDWTEQIEEFKFRVEEG